MDNFELIEWETTYQKISEVLNQARNAVWQAVNTTMVAAYWEIGKIIVEKEQEGKRKSKIWRKAARNSFAAFGKGIWKRI
jgi:Pyruvate/2-oxoacid:ferredoxin oxidoreductase gamma subunit